MGCVGRVDMRGGGSGFGLVQKTHGTNTGHGVIRGVGFQGGTNGPCPNEKEVEIRN